MHYLRPNLFKLLLILLLSKNVHGQTGANSLVSIKTAIQLAEQNYHTLKARNYEVQAAERKVDVVKYIKMPSIDASYQVNLATANNITGLFYPSSILPMTGPPSAKNIFAPVTGSAASILLNWQAITFGQQDAEINTAIAEANSKRLGLKQDQFKNDINVISKYLDVILAMQKLQIHEQNIKRVDVNLRQSRVLSKSGLKPGVDTAFFLSELSKAKIGWLNAKKELETEQWLLAQFMVSDFVPIPTDTSFINRLPITEDNTDSTFSTHPFIVYAKSQLEVSHTKELLLKKSYLPKLNVFGIAFSRGSGVQQDGALKTFNGLELTRYNYGAGLQLTYPIMKYGEVKRQLRVQNFLSQSAMENISQNNSELITQQRIANTTFKSSIEVVNETLQQLKSAQYAFNAIQIRYNTGLVNLSDITQIQYNLLEAELAVKTAYWNAWKALLLQTYVKGDVNVFLNEIK